MCGIAGWWSSSRLPEHGAEVVERMLTALVHRGPDAAGYVCGARVAMGTTRLEVLDPLGGGQPMADASGRHWLAYNGEIYNYAELRDRLRDHGCAFRSTSDTEVVLQALLTWGLDACAAFNGGFAFAWFDSLSGRLCLARDRWGKRPLFVSRLGQDLVFGSEVKALLAHPGVDFRWDRARLAATLRQWTPPPDVTPFAAIDQVAPGSVWILEPGAEWRRHRLFPEGPADDQAATASPEVLRELMHDSVRLRLRSDRPVGVYLSGGIDSSAVATEVRAVRGDLRTFSVAFTTPDFDESAEQATVARSLGADHTSLLVSGSDLAAAFPTALWHAEVPVFRAAFVPMFLLSKRTREAGVPVVLTGEGADEVLFGYDIFREARLRANWGRLDGDGRRTALEDLYQFERHVRTGGGAALAAVFDAHQGDAAAPGFSHSLRWANGRFAERLLRDVPTDADPLLAFLDEQDIRWRRQPLIERAREIEVATLLHGYLLSTQGDRAAFAHGVENRCPFLDPSVTAWAARISPEAHLRPGRQEKWLLRDAYAAALPPAILQRQKVPYRSPDAEAFLAPERARHFADDLGLDALRAIDVLDATYAERVVADVSRRTPGTVAPRSMQALLQLLSIRHLDDWFVKRCPPASAPAPTFNVYRYNQVPA
jgi:asparagine synthase (glutamine-hydrolysing)